MNRCAPPTRRRCARSASSCPAPSPLFAARGTALLRACCHARCCRADVSRHAAQLRPPAAPRPRDVPRRAAEELRCDRQPDLSPRSTAFTTSPRPLPAAAARCCSPAASCSSTPAPRSRTRGRSGPTSPVSPARAAPAQPGRHPDAVRDRWLTMIATRPSAPAHQYAERLGAQAQAPLLDILLLHSAGAARAIAPSCPPASPEVSCYEHLLSRLPEPRQPGGAYGPASPASQAIKDQAFQSAPGTPVRPPQAGYGRPPVNDLAGGFLEV